MSATNPSIKGRNIVLFFCFKSKHKCKAQPLKINVNKQKTNISLLQISQHRVTERAKGCNLAMFPTLEENSNRADIKGIICRHLERPLIQFEKYFSESDNCFCDTEWIQFPFGNSVTAGSRRTVTAKVSLIELSAVADIRSSHPRPCLVVERLHVGYQGCHQKQ